MRGIESPANTDLKVKWRYLVDPILRDDAAFDAPLASLAYANIAVFVAVLFSLAGLNSYSTIHYAMTVFAILFVSAVVAKSSLKLTSRKLVFGISTAAIVLNELTIASILFFDFHAAPQANTFAAIIIVAAISFVSIPLSARYVTPFVISKTMVLGACALVAVKTPVANNWMLEIISSLIVTLLITFFIGYWIINKRRLEVRLRLELSALNDSITNQNTKLQEALADVKAERAKVEDGFALRQRLLSYVGHDLRQPVSAALLMILELSKKRQTAAQKSLLSDTKECLQSVGRMIENVVQITHYNNPEIEVYETPINLDSLLQQIVREYESVAQKAKCRIRYVQTSVNLQSDSDLLTRIIRNLVRNAIDHSGANNLLIGVRHIDRQTEIWIVDDGRGMDIGVIENSGGTKSGANNESSGLGLGLTISRQLASACEMKLTVVSTSGSGTCCKIELLNQHTN